MGRRQASLGTPVPRTPTVAPGPKARSGLASRRSQRSSAERCGPQKPAASVDAWRLIGRGRLRFPMLPRQLLDLTKGWRGQRLPSLFPFALLQIPFLTPRCRNLQIYSNLAPHLRPMAPRKVKSSSAPAWYEPALDAPNITEKSLAAMRFLTAGESNERGKTELRLACNASEPEGSTFFPFFTSSIVAGLVPPFSDFFYEVLDHFGLQALHLHPNSILLLPSSLTIARRIWA